MFPRYQSRQIKPRYEWRPRLDPSHPLSIGCVGLWLLNETGGPTAYDISGSHNDGTLTNGPLWTPGRSGQALKFNGTDNYVNIGVSTVIGSLVTNLTVSAWINGYNISGVSGVQRVFAAARASSVNGFGFGTNDAGLRFTTFGVTDYNSTTITLTQNIWTHIAAVMSGFNVTFYVNGVNRETVTGAANGNANTDDAIYIGAGTVASYSSLIEIFNGLIDEARVYQRALSANEVQWLYQFPYDNIIVEPTRKLWMIPEAAGGAAWLKQGYWWNRNYGGMG